MMEPECNERKIPVEFLSTFGPLSEKQLRKLAQILRNSEVCRTDLRLIVKPKGTKKI
jgi:hypothetical protein